jgi:hypothetical protein
MMTAGASNTRQPKGPQGMARKTLVLVLVALLTLAGCSGGGAADQQPTAASTSATPSPKKQGTATTYASVVELKETAVAAGYPCPAWEAYTEGDGPKFAKEAGQCSDDDVFSIYADDDVEKQLDLVGAGPPDGVNLLVGLNWMINLPESQRAKLQAAIGGEYVGLGDDEPSATPAAPAHSEANIDKSDIKLHVKILRKKCFGYGYGCNVTYRVVVDGADMSDWPKEGEVEVTYKVTGGKDGPESDSFVITLDDEQYEKPWRETSTIRSRSTKLTVKVTDVEYSE